MPIDFDYVPHAYLLLIFFIVSVINGTYMPTMAIRAPYTNRISTHRRQTSTEQFKFLNAFPSIILGKDTNLSASTKNLGVVFYSCLKLRQQTHIPNMQVIFLWHASHSKQSVRIALARQIAVALASGKLDYCNTVFQNIPEKDIAKFPCWSGNHGPTFLSFCSFVKQYIGFPSNVASIFQSCKNRELSP